MSNLFRSTVIKGNRLTDFTQTSVSVGTPMAWGVGRYVVDGNVIFAALPPKEHVARKRQGKGGVKSETYTYTTSYAVSFGLGRIYGYVWIERDGKKVYTTDPNAPVEDRDFSQKWLEKATLYYGTRDQLPDSTIESYKGSGQVSALRDEPYIVLENDDVTSGGGAVPNYRACIIASPPEAYLTSKPFPLYESDGVWQSNSFGVAIQRDLVKVTGNEDAIVHSMSFGTGIIRAPIVVVEGRGEYGENIVVEYSFGTGIIRAPLVSLGPQPSDKLQPVITFNPGLIRNALVTQTQQPEKIQPSMTFGGASIYVP